MNIKDFQLELDKLLEASELLNELYSYLPPYLSTDNKYMIPDSLIRKLNEFYNFDDSE
jgi:hypothetical protein